MDWAEGIDALERFQSLAVGIVGFGGVIFTLWFNAKNARRLQERERDARACAVAALVRSELEILSGAMLLASDFPKPEDGEFVKFPELKIRFLPNVVQELGLLGPELSQKVMLAFFAAENTMAKVSLLADNFEDGYLTVSSQHFDVVSKIYDGHADAIKKALEALASLNAVGK
ncbi:hypothetical protein [Hasllibacter sp. MH4015]|uniref:hypothetical protein n=1 Tax=Hasllibacter sp. MH4015 TaxID=2854029 RepID=UPI001CD323D0|nr:hypothetical protein [Hasllibacter sp. MH4015]